jgi:ribose transport system substrate-binding protein
MHTSLGENSVTKNFGFTTAIALVGLVTACGSDDSASNQKKTVTRVAVEQSIFNAPELEATVNNLIAAIDKTAPETVQLNLNLKLLTGYWEPIVVGANRALGELAVGGAVEAPAPAEGADTAALAAAYTEEQTSMMEEAVKAGAKGFGVAPVYDALADELNSLVSRGIPIMTIDTDIATSNRDLYIGTLNAEAGQTAGNSLKALLPAAPGTVVILGYELPDWSDGYDRTMGAKSVLEQAGYTVVVRRTLWEDGGEAKDVQSMADTIATASPPVVGMIGMFSNAYRCAMAAEAASKTGADIAIAAFDFDSKTVAYMQSGLIKVTHAQRQYYMGYLTPYILYGMNVLGKETTKNLLGAQLVDGGRFNSGLDVVAADKLDQYYSFLDKLGISGS